MVHFFHERSWDSSCITWPVRWQKRPGCQMFCFEVSLCVTEVKTSSAWPVWSEGCHVSHCSGSILHWPWTLWFDINTLPGKSRHLCPRGQLQEGHPMHSSVTGVCSTPELLRRCPGSDFLLRETCICSYCPHSSPRLLGQALLLCPFQRLLHRFVMQFDSFVLFGIPSQNFPFS